MTLMNWNFAKLKVIHKSNLFWQNEARGMLLREGEEMFFNAVGFMTPSCKSLCEFFGHTQACSMKHTDKKMCIMFESHYVKTTSICAIP